MVLLGSNPLVHGIEEASDRWFFLVAKTEDPVLVCHPILALLADMVWGRVAQWTFLFQKSWFLFTLILFMAGQSVLKYAPLDNLAVEPDPILALRSFIYFFSMAQLIWTHGS